MNFKLLTKGQQLIGMYKAMTNNDYIRIDCENAYITNKHPYSWKAQVDNFALKYPNACIQLITSLRRRHKDSFDAYRFKGWADSKKIVTE